MAIDLEAWELSVQTYGLGASAKMLPHTFVAYAKGVSVTQGDVKSSLIKAASCPDGSKSSVPRRT